MTYLDGLPDTDRQETAEWADALRAVAEQRGKARARFLLRRLIDESSRIGLGFPAPLSTPYLNTFAGTDQPYPGDERLEARIEALVRWNAAVMVTRANAASPGIGGHLSTYASSATLYEVGFQHFFRGRDGVTPDQVYVQGHATPGIYARAYLEGRLDEDDLDHFRREVGRSPGRTGLSSYPHPRLMPEFWEFPTVSMGLGPINAIYQARFNRYLHNRGITDTSAAKVWCFLGDGECDEPEALGALSVAAREPLDNLIFVVNCNLQRLDGPVRGNGKVIQELESVFAGAGWNTIKVVWGSGWDGLLAADRSGVLLDRLTHTVDGEFQKYAVEGGAYFRERFFGPDPALAELVEHLSDEDLQSLCWGGHDRGKVYDAYRAAVGYEGAPTVVLAKTVKGHGLGSDIAARNATHQIKKMNKAQLTTLRDTLGLGDLVSDGDLDSDAPLYRRCPPGSAEDRYLQERRRALGGAVPRRVARCDPLDPPDPRAFESFQKGSDGRQVSTTMAFAMLLKNLLRDEAVGRRIVPIIPDEGRTFGLDALFAEVQIYAPTGQRYEPVDASMRLSYKESRQGQIMEEGITEAGSMGSFTAAGTCYATWGEPMVPFYLFYSMFGFQRVGDLIWAFGDQRGRGFLLGATAGRTTLNGEGLQHEDGHSLVLASTVPNLAAYDPAFAYELAEIVRDGIHRMYDGEDPEDVFYYVTLYNENYEMPPMPEGAREGILRGLYRFAEAPEVPKSDRRRATILFSGTAQAAAREAQRLLADAHGVAAELWSVTSYKALREDALSVERWNRLHPDQPDRAPYVTRALEATHGPIVAVTDFMKLVPDQVARWVPAPFVALGTDGYGRSDTRATLRRHFETDAAHVTVAVLDALVSAGDAKPEEVAEAIATHGIDPEAVDPRSA